VLGILAILASITVIGGVIFGLLALIFGFIGRGRAKRGEATNGGIALAGAITGLIGLLLSVALITFGVSILNSNSGKNYQSCLKQATNQAAQQACAQQFGQQLTKLPSGISCASFHHPGGAAWRSIPTVCRRCAADGSDGEVTSFTMPARLAVKGQQIPA